MAAVRDVYKRQAVMDEGRLMGMGDTREVFADPGTRTGAVLTGCKNIVAAKKAAEHRVEIPEWGVSFETDKPVKDGLCAVGIRAHYFGAEIRQNAFPVHIVEEIEEPFAWIIKFRYEGQAEESTPIWWRLSKAQKGPEAPDTLGIAPGDILLLYA